jgi:hypothetical protein
MLRHILPVLSGLLALSVPALASATDWRAAAQTDLAAIHDLLKANSPAPLVDRDSAHFRDWLETGYAVARTRLPGVHDAYGYAFLLRGYVVGFRDSHIFTSPTRAAGVDLNQPAAWPGFSVGLRGRDYRVAYRDPAETGGPPVGARLLACDGRSVETMVQARDRLDGNLQLESGRFFAARFLLTDRGDPFVARPDRCVFEAGGRKQTWRLNWRPADLAGLKPALAAASGIVERKLDVAQWGERGWWISVPFMDDAHDWTGFYQAVDRHLTAIRDARTVVIDLRGNGGGSNGYGEKLARTMWGEGLVDAHEPDLGPTLWRATRINRDFWAGLVAGVEADPHHALDELSELKSILADYDKALAEGRESFRRARSSSTQPPAPPSPMRGRVILLTDQACNSACLDLMDLFTRLPGTVQAGAVTSADTIFMELTRVDPLPSGFSSFGFGHKAWVARPRGSNQPYRPAADWTWRGDPMEEAGLRTWLAERLDAAG